MNHFDILAATIGVPLAKDALRELRAAGYIIVRRGAIGQAQREAVAAYREDNASIPMQQPGGGVGPF